MVTQAKPKTAVSVPRQVEYPHSHHEPVASPDLAGPDTDEHSTAEKESRKRPSLDPKSKPKSWAYSSADRRDYRLDLLRGFLVFAMIVDHIGGDSPLTAITGYNHFLVSAAEGFIFISGLLMGIVYSNRARRAGLGVAVRAMLRRATALYVTFTSLTIAFVLMRVYTELPIWMTRDSWLGVDQVSQALVGTLTLHYAYHGTDILLLYVLLVAIAPLALYMLLSGRTAPLLIGIWTMWGLYQLYPEQMSLPWNISNSISFPMAAWQALFYTGLVLGFHQKKVASWTRPLRSGTGLLSLTFGFIGLLAIQGAHTSGRLAELGVSDSSFLAFFSKVNLGPGRVLAFAVISLFASALVTRLWLPISRLFGPLLLPLGEKSLLAYGAHLFLIGPAYALFVGDYPGADSAILVNLVPQLAVVLTVLAIVKLQPLIIAAYGASFALVARLYELAHQQIVGCPTCDSKTRAW